MTWAAFSARIRRPADTRLAEEPLPGAQPGRPADVAGDAVPRPGDALANGAGPGELPGGAALLRILPGPG